MVLEFRDLLMYNSSENILSIGDVHIGLEEAMNKQGWLVPRHAYKEMKARIKKQLDALKTKKQTIVLLGDLKHEFGRISEQEWRDTLDFIDFLSEFGKIILIQGNHDSVLGPIAGKKNIELLPAYKAGEYLYMHGDRLPTKTELSGVKTIIIGHEHPAITLHDGAKRETYKCFLDGTWKMKRLIVQPSIHTLTEGTDVLKEKLMSPMLKDISKFKVYIVGESAVLDFGNIKKLQENE